MAFDYACEKGTDNKTAAIEGGGHFIIQLTVRTPETEKVRI
uniref:Uncharacterized protein n=1 Tax=Anguilla anguilla TaxID=7936 RepID=A0A0E9Q048_ANGAN